MIPPPRRPADDPVWHYLNETPGYDSQLEKSEAPVLFAQGVPQGLGTTPVTHLQGDGSEEVIDEPYFRTVRVNEDGALAGGGSNKTWDENFKVTFWGEK